MKYIFTLSGNSKRFTDSGFLPKYLIKIQDRMVIEYVVDMFPGVPQDSMIFIINDKDNEKYLVSKVLKELYPGSRIEVIPQNTQGPVYSILEAIKYINCDKEEILVSYCDLFHKWNFSDFQKYLQQTKCDGCLVTHTGYHPHRLGKMNFAHLKVNGGDVLEVKEKGYFTENPINEYASSGIYYFRTGAIMKRYFEDMIFFHTKVNGEFFVTLAYNRMIRDSRKVVHYPTDNYVCFGTPEDLCGFIVWMDYLKKGFDTSKISFLFDYWQRYNKHE